MVSLDGRPAHSEDAGSKGRSLTPHQSSTRWALTYWRWAGHWLRRSPEPVSARARHVAPETSHRGDHVMGLLDGRVCVITGGAGSLGLASARRFLDEGAKVMLVDLEGATRALARRPCQPERRRRRRRRQPGDGGARLHRADRRALRP